MIVLTNTNAVVIQPGEVVPFNKVIFRTKCGECWNHQLPSRVKLRQGGVYSLGFSGNVTSSTAAVQLQLAIAVAGVPLVETAMNSVPAAPNDLNNISTETRYGVGCADADVVTVMNTGTEPVTLAPNSSFVIDNRG